MLNLKAKMNPDGTYIFSGETELGSMCIAEIDPSANIPFLRIDFYKKGETKPLLSFSRLEANADIDTSLFRFPIKALMERGLTIEAGAADQKHWVNLMSLMGRVLFIRSALAFPDMRKGLKKLGIHDSDWPVIQERDTRISQALKEVFID